MNDCTAFPFSGEAAFVTGGASGIGLAIARALVSEGMRVVLADNHEAALDMAVAELGDAATGVLLDVTDRESWAEAKATVEAQLGPLAVLVNNAGIGPDLHPLAGMPPENWDRLIAVMLTGTFNGVRCFVPDMVARSRGHVVNTASMAGLYAGARLGAYTAAKFGVIGLSEVLRAEVSPEGLGVSVLCPGLVATNLGETTTRAGIVRGTAMPPSTREAMPASRVAELVIAGIRENHSHIVTHPEYRKVVAARFDPIMAAFDRIS